MYRTFRKKDGAITIAAQNVLFLKNCPPAIKDSILINCDTKVILDHSSYRKELPNLRDILSISEEELVMIDSLQNRDDEIKWREFFIKLGNETYVFAMKYLNLPLSLLIQDNRLWLGSNSFLRKQDLLMLLLTGI